MTRQLLLFPNDPVFGRKISTGARGLFKLILSFARGPKGAIPFQKTLASRLGVTVRTLQRWVSELSKAGLLLVKKRQRTSAKYYPLSSGLHMENVGSKHSASSLSEKLPVDTPRKGPTTAMESNQIAALDPGFREFMEVPWRHGKALNDLDAHKAFREWSKLGTVDRINAVQGYKRLFAETREVRFVPLPANYLASQAWTRVANPNPVVRKSKTEEALERLVQMTEFIRRIG